MKKTTNLKFPTGAVVIYRLVGEGLEDFGDHMVLRKGKGGEISRYYQSIKGGEHKKVTAIKGDHDNNTKP